MTLIAKVVYSMLLLGLAGFLLREVWTVWFDKTIYIGRFDVISETGKDDSASATFPKRIVGAQAILAQQFNDYQTHRAADTPSDATYILPGMTPLLLPPEVLAGVDITVQGINLRQVLTTMRKAFLAPSEVTGNVAIREGSVLGAVDWPLAPQTSPVQPALTKFLVPGQSSEQAAAAYIACSLAWARAAGLDSSGALYSRAQFCDFGAALGDLYALREKASSPSGLDIKDSALVRKRASQLRAHYGADAIFPEIYRLRADLLDLLPEGARKQEELVEAQEDRTRYAMLSPKLRNLPDEEKRLTALALARPAISLEDDGRLSVLPDNWASLLRHYDKEIRPAATSVGLILRSDNTPVGTGFVVAPGLMITANYVLGAGGDIVDTSELSDMRSKDLRLCLGTSHLSCASLLNIGDVIYSGKEESSKIALVNLVGHDAVVNPPILIAETAQISGTIVGRYALVIGYPFSDARMPAVFNERLLGKEGGRKRVMPGRILSFGQGESGSIGLENGQLVPAVITSDISTSGGTGGGPLIDMSTGRVIGMSYGGLWKGERGKFAYAEPIPKKAVDIILRRLRGETEITIKLGGGAISDNNKPPAK